MNPFRLHGVEFLFFYIAFALVVTLALRALIRAREKIPSLPPPRLDDPYLIAHLRAGPDEALRVATLSLADRNLLAADGGTLQQQDPRGVDLVKREIEKAVLHGYRRPGKADAVLKDRAALQACRHYQELLERHGLVAGAAAFAARAPAVAIALALVLGAAAVKIVLALSQGRHNIGFLIALAAIFGFVNYRIWRSRRTSAGDAALADLATLFKRLKGRAKTLRPGGASNEVALLVAVFGISALPAAAFPFVEQIYPKPPSAGDSSSSDSDSGSGGSSCSGGCGGGGCGGE